MLHSADNAKQHPHSQLDREYPQRVVGTENYNKNKNNNNNKKIQIKKSFNCGANYRYMKNVFDVACIH